MWVAPALCTIWWETNENVVTTQQKNVQEKTFDIYGSWNDTNCIFFAFSHQYYSHRIRAYKCNQYLSATQAIFHPFRVATLASCTQAHSHTHTHSHISSLCIWFRYEWMRRFYKRDETLGRSMQRVVLPWFIVAIKFRLYGMPSIGVDRYSDATESVTIRERERKRKKKWLKKD